MVRAALDIQMMTLPISMIYFSEDFSLLFSFSVTGNHKKKEGHFFVCKLYTRPCLYRSPSFIPSSSCWFIIILYLFPSLPPLPLIFTLQNWLFSSYSSSSSSTPHHFPYYAAAAPLQMHSLLHFVKTFFLTALFKKEKTEKTPSLSSFSFFFTFFLSFFLSFFFFLPSFLSLFLSCVLAFFCSFFLLLRFFLSTFAPCIRVYSYTKVFPIVL